jgi:Sensors of blue-light using FAD
MAQPRNLSLNGKKLLFIIIKYYILRAANTNAVVPISTMIELIYYSNPAEDLQISHVYKLLEQARQFNTAHDMTGVLMFTNRYFVQALEGDAGVVRDLAGRIERDRRHQGFSLLGERAIEQRTWANWSMGLIMPNARSREVITNYCKGDLQPQALQLNTAHDLLLELTRVSTDIAQGNPNN